MSSSFVPGASATLAFSSANRAAGSASSADFVLAAPAPASGNLSMSLSALSLPNVFQFLVVTTGANDKIDFNDGAPHTATVTAGTYTGSTLAAAVQAAMNAVSAGYTVTYASSTGLTTISKGGTFSLLWASGANAATSTRLLLGFQQVDDTGASSYTSDMQPARSPTTVCVSVDTTFVTVTSKNSKIDFNDGVATRVATIAAGTYTQASFLTAVAAALNGAGSGLTFAVAANAVSGLATVSAGSNFSLLWASGANAATNARAVLGFAAADLSGAATYTSAFAPFAAATSADQTDLPAVTVVSGKNDAIDFNDGAPKTALVPAGIYTVPNFVAAVQTALNAVGAGFVVTLAQYVTIANAGAFSLLWASGPHAATSAAGLLGFSAVDRTGANTYTAQAVALPTAAPGTKVDSLQVNTSATGAGVAYAWQVPVSVGLGLPQTLAMPATRLPVKALKPVTLFHIKIMDLSGTALALGGANWEGAFTFT